MSTNPDCRLHLLGGYGEAAQMVKGRSYIEKKR